MIDQIMDFRYRGSESADGVIRLSASELACYRWPEDTAEHRAMRSAFMEGAASMASAVSAASAEVVQTQDDLGALLHAAEAEVERLRDERAIDNAIQAAEIERLRHDVERFMKIANDAINGAAQAPLNAKELIDAALRHADGITAQLAKPDWEPSRAHIKQARNSIEKLAGLLVQIVVPGS
jgi:hypothetical protein